MPTAFMVLIPHDMDPQFSRKALYLLRENIRALLTARKEDQTTLARWCGRGKSWINKFLNGNRDLRLADLDRIASFFGVEAYQLFQPGVARDTERRAGVDRRMLTERRLGHSGRLIETLQKELNKVPYLTVPKSGDSGHGVASVPSAVQKILSAAERSIAEYYSTHPDEAHRASPARPAVAPRRRGKADRPDGHPRKKASGHG